MTVLHSRSALLFAVTIAALLAPAPARAQARRPITATDIYRFKAVGEPRISPDGQWIAYTVGVVDSAKDSRTSDLWMVRWDGSQTLRLTSTPGGESDPRWSPDGRWISFIATREGAKK